MTTSVVDVMPDQLTCLRTPRDQHGDPMCEGRLYWIDEKRWQCFEADGVLFVQEAIRLGVALIGSRPVRVDELASDVKVHRA